MNLRAMTEGATRHVWVHRALAATVVAGLLGGRAEAQPLLLVQSQSGAHQGANVAESRATLTNGVLTTSVGAGGGATGSPTGWPATEGQVTTIQPGSAGGQSFTNVSMASANFLTGVLRGSSNSTPINNFATPIGITTSRLEDTVYFLNTTAAPATVAVSWTVQGLITPNTVGPAGSFDNYATIGFYDTPTHPMPTMRGTSGGTRIMTYQWTSTYTLFRDPLWGTQFPVGNGPIWNIAMLGTNSAVMSTTLSLPVGMSAMHVRGRFDLWCNGGMTCDYSLDGATIRFTLPDGVLLSSESGSFLGSPRPSATPSNLSVVSVVGNRATFRWSPPTTTPATGYVLEGGVVPGEVLGSLPTGNTATTFTVDLPTGAFYVRIHALTSSGRSAPTNEVRVFVNVPQPPATPTRLLGLANGSTLGLSWFNPPAGGPPASMILDVSGSASVSLPLPPGERFAFTGVPPGTYTFTVRAANGSGSSSASAPVTLTFPSACSGAPQTPLNLTATDTGRFLTVSWEPPSSGAAVGSYVLDVSGAVTLSVPLSARTISSPVPPGSYTFSVRAVNACGTSASSAPVTVAVP